MHVYQYLWDRISRQETVHTTLMKRVNGSIERIAWTDESCFPKNSEVNEYIKVYEEQSRQSGNQDHDYELIYPLSRLVIFGAGHIAKVLCEMAYLAGFIVVVYDDRSELITEERFPHAAVRICAEYEDIWKHLTYSGQDYYVILTHGHICDELCARQILMTSYTYLGMIGSKAKVAATRSHLIADGFLKEKVDSMYAPIGIKLGGNTPGEIAVSITAQLIQVKYQREQKQFDAEIGEWLSDGTHRGIMVTICKKEGSGPRKQGSRMFVMPDQSTIGTIGGGALELQAVKDAIVIRDLTKKHYELNERPGGLSMACEGSVDLLFEPIGE